MPDSDDAPNRLARELDSRIRSVRKEHRAAEHRLAKLLTEMVDTRGYLHLGYSTIHHYAQEVLDLTPRQTRSLVQVGRMLPELPELDRAFGEGEIGWTKARELLRVATPDTEQAWIERAKQLTSRQLEKAISGAVYGEAPAPVVGEDLAPSRRRLVFELEAGDAELVLQAISLVAQQTGLEATELDRGAALAAMARHVLDATSRSSDAPTSTPYRIVLEHCPRCAATKGLDFEASDTVVSEASCDHDVVEMDPPHRGRRRQGIPPRVRREVLLRDKMRCAVPGCRCSLWLHLHHVQQVRHGGPHVAENLVTLCSVHHRLLHEGYLACWLGDEGVHFELADGRHLIGRYRHGDPRGSPA